MKKTTVKKVLSVIIPLYNEEEFICRLLDKTAQAKVSVPMEIIIVNDGSTDNSRELALEWIRSYKEKNPATPHSFTFLEKPNGGKGSAVKMGIAHSTGEVVIIQDADLEYDPDDYEKCIRPILHGECSVVYGSREKENRNRLFSSPFFFLGGLFLTWWMDLLFNAHLTDEPTCYKTFSGPLIRSIPLDGDQFDWEPEVTAKLLRMGFEIREEPISYYPRKTDQGKKIRFTDGFQGFLVALYWRFASLKMIRKNTAKVSDSFRKTIRQQKVFSCWFLGIFLLAFLLRAFCALPGFLTPGQRNLMYVDSYPFLAMAGKGFIQNRPKLYTPYPSGFRTIKEKEIPPWKKVMNNQTRAPLYVLYLSCVFALTNHHLILTALAGCLLGALSCAFVFLAGDLWGSKVCGIIGGLLMALHPTAILYSALFLPDTLFLLLVTLQVWFFLRFVKNGFGLNLIAAVVFAASGALIRPVNALWIIPCIGVLFFCKKVPTYLRFNYMCLALLLFTAVLLPALWCSKVRGSGWRIDSISSESLMKNVLHLESKLRNKPYHKVRQELQTSLTKKYALDPGKYKTLGAQLLERDKIMLKKIMEHPVSYIKSHFNLRIWEPDLTGYFIRFRCSSVQSRKITGTILLICYRTFLLVLLLGLFWYFMAEGTPGFLMKLLLFLALGAYYLLMPGAIADGRYLLPALPFLCLASAFGSCYLYRLVKEQKTPEAL